MGQQRLGAMADALRGQYGTKWSGLPHEKQGCLALVASAEGHVAVCSGSAADHHMEQLAASFRQN